LEKYQEANITHQHSCHKKILAKEGVVKVILSSSLITMQNLITLSHTVHVHVRVSEIWGCWGLAPLW